MSVDRIRLMQKEAVRRSHSCRLDHAAVWVWLFSELRGITDMRDLFEIRSRLSKRFDTNGGAGFRAYVWLTDNAPRQSQLPTYPERETD